MDIILVVILTGTLYHIPRALQVKTLISRKGYERLYV